MLDMKLTFFMIISTIAIIAAVGNKTAKTETPAPVTIETAKNCTVGDSTIIACYPISGIDFVFQIHKGKTYISTDTGQTCFDAEIYISAPNEFEAVRDGEFVRTNTSTGVTTYFIGGEYCIFLPE